MSQHQPSKRPFSVGRALALFPVLLLVVMGCSTIIGLGDYSVESGGSGGAVSAGGRAGKGGGSSSSGNSSSGEAGAPAEQAGTGGTGGSSGSGTVTGTAGTTGEAGAGEAGAGPVPSSAVGCDGVTPITVNEQVVRSCILRAGCDPFNPVRSISQCVTNNTQDAFAGERCNLRSKTCADYEACEHKGIAGDDLCPVSKYGTDFCSGNKAVSCTADGKFSSWVDCIGQGGTACGTYLCPPASANCTSGSLVSDCKIAKACVGNQDYVCSTEVPNPIYEYQCVAGQAYGAKCGDFAYCDDSSGAAGCFLTATSCDADSTSCTVDNVAKVCAGGGEYDYDCGSVGLSCKIGAANSSGDTNYCLAPGCKPADVNSCAEFCDGTKLNFCYGGAQVAADCLDYGFSGCEDSFSSDSLPSYATCVN